MSALVMRIFRWSVLGFGTGLMGCAAGPDDAPEAWEETAEQEGALRVCAADDTVEGIDVSYWQEAIDWPAVAGGTTDFAFIRAYYGSEFKDPRFDENWAAAKAAGLPRGAYQYFRPGQDPLVQAQKMIDALADDPGELPPVLDIESKDGMSNATIRARMQTWLEAVESATGRRPLIYTAAFMQSTIGTGFADYPLWVANYTQLCPLIPTGWNDWVFWQYTESGSVDGVQGDVDQNQFNGSIDELLAFGELGTIPAPPPDEQDPEPPPPPTDPNDPDPPDPVGPTGLSPANGAQFSSGSVTMSCEAFGAATSYQFEIERYSSGQGQWIAYYAYTTTQPQKTFWPATTSAYRFRVRALAGSWSPYSAWSAFAFGNASIP